MLLLVLPRGIVVFVMRRHLLLRCERVVPRIVVGVLEGKVTLTGAGHRALLRLRESNVIRRLSDAQQVEKHNLSALRPAEVLFLVVSMWMRAVA